MSVKGGKTKRIGKHYFRLIGKDSLYFKGEHLVSFAPLPKKYPSYHTAKIEKIEPSCPSSTMTASTTPTPFNCPPSPQKTINNFSKNMRREPLSLSSSCPNL